MTFFLVNQQVKLLPLVQKKMLPKQLWGISQPIIFMDMVTFIQRPVGTNLTVNLDAEKHYVVERSEEDGIRDLRRLTRTEKVEEAWIFVEGVDSNGNKRNLWYEIGTNEQPREYRFSSAIPELIFYDLERQDIELLRWNHYHLHSQSQLKPTTADMPSAPDMTAVHFFAVYREAKKWPFPMPDVRVVTPNGLWTMKFVGDYPVNIVEEEKYLKNFKQHQSAIVFIQLQHLLDCTDAIKEFGSNHLGELPPACLPDYQSYEEAISFDWIKATFETFDKKDTD